MPEPFDQRDEVFMRRALQLARRGEGQVEPNPMVGCVLVRKGRIVGEGFHRRFGGPHAEVHALQACRSSPRGATAYVTLEPCCYRGKTPPCTDALLRAGVARVVAAVRDPNPRVSGRGGRVLRAAGVGVEFGLLAAAGRELIAPFAKRMRTGMPWVILKWAQSLDGAIATRTGDSKWISDEACRAHAHRTRGRVDAIVVGINTVLRDDPLLTCRVGRIRRAARRVIFDAELRTPRSSKLVKTAQDAPTWIFCSRSASRRRETALSRAGCVIHRVSARRGTVDPRPALKKLADAGCANVLVEGGGALLGHFCDTGFADEFHIYLAPRLIGGQASVRALAGEGAALVREGTRLRVSEFKRIGDGWFLRARPAPP